MDNKGTLPDDSDRIAQDSHLIPFSRLNYRFSRALNTFIWNCTVIIIARCVRRVNHFRKDIPENEIQKLP